MKRIRKIDFYIALYSVLALIVVSCKKSNTESTAPKAVVVTAKIVEFQSMPSSIEPKGGVITFDYEGSPKRVFFDRVDQGNENGSVIISNTDVVLSSSTLLSAPSSNSAAVSSLLTPNTLEIAIDKFATDIVDGNTSINKLTINIDGSTIFYLSGQTAFAAYKQSDMATLRANAKTIGNLFNDILPSQTGNQRLPVKVYVKNY